MCNHFHSSFLQLYEPCQCHILKNSPTLPNFSFDVVFLVIFDLQTCVYYGRVQRLPDHSSGISHLFKCCSTNFKGCFCVVDVHTCQGTWLHHLSFSLKQDQSLPADSRYFCSSPQLLLGSWITDSSIHSSVWNKAGRIWSQPVYGEIMFFPLPSYRSNTAQWDIQCLIISSVTMPSACYETTGLWRS